MGSDQFWIIANDPKLVNGGYVIKSELFRAARALLNWSQTELAEHAGMSLATVKRIETGRGPTVSDDAREKLKATLEAAGIEFMNGTAPGVRLKPRRRG